VLSEDSAGADLLGSVAAALAATGEVFGPLDPSFSSLAISYAQKVYAFATLNSDTSTPQSYCRFVPCTANVTAKKQVRECVGSDIYGCHAASWYRAPLRFQHTTQ
jgi:hypothetical protein